MKRNKFSSGSRRGESISNFLTLNNGLRMPVVGIGQLATSTEQETQLAERILEVALCVGYRHIDTSTVNHNEQLVGRILRKAIANGNIERSDLFVTTKLPDHAHRREKVEPYLRRSLQNLMLDYVDLYVIQSPTSRLAAVVANEEVPRAEPDLQADLVDTWQGLEDVVELGLTRSIGMANFNSHQIQRIYDNARIKPANVQIECHLHFQQKHLYDFCQSLDITCTAYIPVGPISSDDQVNFPSDPIVLKVARRVKKTPAQVDLRWLIQRGFAVIPYTTSCLEVIENFQLFDFRLCSGDMKRLNEITVNKRIYDYIPTLKNHPNYPFHDDY